MRSSKKYCFPLVTSVLCMLILMYSKNYFLQSDDLPAATHEFILPHEVGYGIQIVGNQFVLERRPLHIIAGSFHYFRTPSEYWGDILRKMKAAGLNAVSTYVEWSFHETEERVYKFTDDYDVAKFVRMAAKEGLLVLLRPGPYICAGRDMGGLPYWLLSKYPSIRLRTSDKNFMKEVRTWFAKLFAHLRPLLYGAGGPIILVQIENEYGSYGHDPRYLEKLNEILKEHVRNKALLYTADMPGVESIYAGAVDGALATINFGTINNMQSAFRHLREFMATGPLMNSEFYTGWKTHWGGDVGRVSTYNIVNRLTKLLENNASLNFYVFFGGTNFEFSSGANYGGTFVPSITSYDYDAPLNEAGDPTPKYYAIREVLSKYNKELKESNIPKLSPKGNYGEVKLDNHINLMSSDGRKQVGKVYRDVQGATLPTFEQLRQRAGLLLFETVLNESNGVLEVLKPRDWVYVYVDGELKGILNRMYKKYQMKIVCNYQGATLSLLVENQGRVNFDSHIHDFKGIKSLVKLNNNVLNGTWKITGYPLEVLNLTIRDHQPQNKHGPFIHQGRLTLPVNQTPLDTWINTRGWRKGYIWINGHNLGRYWPALGPQVTLYVPGVWLRPAPASNLVQVLEFEQPHTNYTLKFIDHQIFMN